MSGHHCLNVNTRPYCVCSLFDNHTSPSFEANLDYMFRNFGFYFPDAEYLTDPEGLLKYLVSSSLYFQDLKRLTHPDGLLK